ncbi:hypothetical protein [Paenibacillus marinisediminis]
MMRKYALTRSNPSHEIPKIMIYETEESGTYLFLYNSLDDKTSHNDYCFDELEDAENFSKQYFDNNESDWIYIEDPFENCQHDLIRSIRRKGKPTDNQFEIYEDH